MYCDYTCLIVGIIALILIFLFYMGVFKQITWKEKYIGPIRIAFLQYTGPYSGVGKTFEEVGKATAAAGYPTTCCEPKHKDKDDSDFDVDFNTDLTFENTCYGVGVYFDDPHITPADKLRTWAGVILGKNVTSKEKEGILKQHGLTIKSLYLGNKFDKVKSILTQFPLRNIFSYMLGPMKVYPSIPKVYENVYTVEESCEIGCMEIYREKDVIFAIPVETDPKVMWRD